MANVDETDSSLATKCLAFCQALSSQGKAFQFSLNIGSTFSFTLDTRCKETLATKKKASPSTLRRNAKRREEFLKRKRQPAQHQEKSETVKEKPRQRAAFQCDQCDNHFKSESGLKIHIGKSHKAQQAAEILRGDLEEEALNISQQSEVTREEVGEEKGEPVSPLQPSPSTPPPILCIECEEVPGNTWFNRVGEPWCQDCLRVIITSDG